MTSEDKPTLPPEKQPVVGTRLREAREARGLTVAQAAESIGVREAVVQALEEDRFDRLGAPVYVRGYLRKYAILLDLPVEPLLKDYQALGSPVEPEVRAHILNSLGGRNSARWLAPVSGAIIIAILILVALWGYRHLERMHERARSAAIPTTSSAAVTAAKPPIARTQTGGAMVPAGKVATPTAKATSEGTTATPVASDDGTQIQLVLSQPSWVEVDGPAHQRLYYNLASAGKTLSFSPPPGPVTVFLGNAAGVKVFVNGKPYSPTDAIHHGKTTRFVIQATSASPAATSQAGAGG